MSVEQRNVNQQAWMESLAGLFGAMISGEASLEEKREKLQLDAERLFDSMDVYKQGSLSLNIFSNWIQDNCCYNLKQSELVSLQSRFDKNNDYRITKEQFVEAVSALQEEEEQEVDEETGDNVAKAEAKWSVTKFRVKHTIRRVSDKSDKWRFVQHFTVNKFEMTHLSAYQ